jgi:hypothetical protein
MDYNPAPFDGSGLSYEFFRILLDGVAVSNATRAWDLSTLEPGDPAGGEWFLTANSDPGSDRVLTAILLSGTGMFDEFVVTNGQVSFSIQHQVTASVVPDYAGSVTPDTSNTLAGTDVTFTITPDAYWDVANAVVDGVSNVWTSTTYTLSNVTDEVNLVFELNAQRGVSNVPLWWLDAMGVTTDGDANDDGDALLNWQEWLMQSNPNDSNSWGQVTVTVINGSNVVSYTADGMVDPELPDLRLDKGTNLLDGLVEETTIPREPSSVEPKTWTEAITDAFYRVRGTN